jgi:hypothetical protein
MINVPIALHTFSAPELDRMLQSPSQSAILDANWPHRCVGMAATFMPDPCFCHVSEGEMRREDLLEKSGMIYGFATSQFFTHWINPQEVR